MNWQDLKQTPLENIVAWAETQPWCQAMAACDQDAEWHSEGDVWTHTKMVCQQLTELEEWLSLTDDERIVLTFTALLHDAAKPITSQTDPDTGRITTPKHAVKGEHIARGILRKLECDLETREQIARLVRYHGRPAFLLERSEPTHEVVRLSWLVNNRLLFLFALADTRGRDTDSMSRPEENLHYWKLMAEETNCYNQPYPFTSDHARFVFFRQHHPNLYYVPHENFACDVTLVSGLPGSGKDTWLARNRPELPVISLDGIRGELGVEPTDNQGKVVQLARERARELLRAGTPFAFNATNILRQTRGRWIDLFADYNARIKLVWIEPPFEKLLRQNGSRENAVPEQVVRKLAAKYEPPTLPEGHKLQMIDGESQ
jgi:putative nucleotidyltransferase with HDIG domain